jgi:drug/metabolite transporter (DMT)-like permease
VVQLVQSSVEYLAQSLAKKARELAKMDSTAIGIACGLICAVVYSCTLLYFKKTFDLQHTILFFLGGFSMPGGVGLIVAGYYGSADDLPSNWREHLVVAGIAIIGLSAQYLVSRLFNCMKSANMSAVVNAKSETGGG